MKGRGLIFALVLSLAMNAAALSTVGYHRLSERFGHERGEHGRPGYGKLPLDYLRKELSLSDKQAEKVSAQGSQLDRQVEQLTSELRQRRMELVSLLAQDQPDRQRIDEKLSRISALQIEIQKRVVAYILEISQLLEPQQRKKFISLIQERLRHEEHHGGVGLLIFPSEQCGHTENAAELPACDFFSEGISVLCGF